VGLTTVLDQTLVAAATGTPIRLRSIRSRHTRSSLSTITACTTRGARCHREGKAFLRLQMNFLH